MKEFIVILRRFVPPYKKCLALNILFNLLTAFLTLFSFALIIPILQMLFKINTEHYSLMHLGDGSLKDVAFNNFYYYTQELIVDYGPVATLGAGDNDRTEDRDGLSEFLLHNSDALGYSSRYPQLCL